jgi:hypothetical protein
MTGREEFLTVVSSVVSLSDESGMSGDSLVDYLSLESQFGVNDVVDGTEDTIGLDDGVVSLGQWAISDFSGTLLISGDFISDSVIVRVFRVSIKVESMAISQVSNMSISSNWVWDSRNCHNGESQSKENGCGLHVDAFFKV